MKKIIKYTLIIFGLTSIHSCIDQIPITVAENKNEYLIVNAELRDNETLHSISLKINSQASSDFQADFPVDDAKVKIIENGTKSYDFLMSDKGNYTNNTLVLKAGNTYQLEIDYKNIIYESTAEILLESLPMKELKTLVSQESFNNPAGNISAGSLVGLYVNADLPKEEDIFLKYSIKGIYQYIEIGTPSNLNPLYCFVDESIDFDNISLVEKSDLTDGKLLNKLIIKKVVDYRFSQNYCMKVYQERITENAFNFWKLVENEYSRTGDIFEKPPGILRGNIIEQSQTDISVVGLFSVIAVDSMNLFIPPSKVGSPRSECRSFNNRPSRCTDCLSIPNSSLIKPECFE